MSRHINAKRTYLGGDPLNESIQGDWLAQHIDGRWMPIAVVPGFEPVTYVLWNGMEVSTPRCQSRQKDGYQCGSAGRLFDAGAWRCGRHGGH